MTTQTDLISPEELFACDCDPKDMRIAGLEEQVAAQESIINVMTEQLSEEVEAAYQNGHSAGFDDGYDEGYNNGYDEGREYGGE